MTVLNNQHTAKVISSTITARS